MLLLLWPSVFSSSEACLVMAFFFGYVSLRLSSLFDLSFLLILFGNIFYFEPLHFFSLEAVRSGMNMSLEVGRLP